MQGFSRRFCDLISGHHFYIVVRQWKQVRGLNGAVGKPVCWLLFGFLDWVCCVAVEVGLVGFLWLGSLFFWFVVWVVAV